MEVVWIPCFWFCDLLITLVGVDGFLCFAFVGWVSPVLLVHVVLALAVGVVRFTVDFTQGDGVLLLWTLLLVL